MDVRPLRLSPAFMATALTSLFFLPCVELTLNDRPIGGYRWVDFVQGFDFTLLDRYEPFRIAPDTFATLLFVCVLAGLLVSLFPGSKNQAVCSLLAAIAGVSLLQMQADFAWLLTEAHHIGAVQPVYQPAFFILLALFLPVTLLGVPYASLARAYRFILQCIRRRRLLLRDPSPRIL